jgi:hypothetical protein
MSVNPVEKSDAVDSGRGDGPPPTHVGRAQAKQMDRRFADFYDDYMMKQKAAVPAYGLVYFDHLCAEYLSLKQSVSDEGAISLIEGLRARRVSGDPPITWSDIYTLDLELTKFLPPESLLHKAYDLRARYRRVAGHREYDSYMSTKPPDLAGISVPRAGRSSETPTTPPATATRLDAAIEMSIREDIKYLMSRIYLEYALMPLREGVRALLTGKGVKWTLSFVACLAAFILISLASTAFPEQRALYILTRGSTVGVVVVAGIVGGLVSMLQRIQAAPGDGDALHSLASLTSGWRGIFLAPLSGAIFSSLLFALFAGGVLKGAVFPEIRSPAKTAITEPTTTQWVPLPPSNEPSARGTSPATTLSPAPQPSPVNTPTVPAPPAGDDSASASGASPDRPADSAKRSANPPGVPANQSAPPRTLSGSGINSIPFIELLRETGPASGADYALLIIWSFIAGFAERLVPDTLNRLVAKAAVPGR